MLQVVHDHIGGGARGRYDDLDVSEFLKSVLIEVVSENYRHLMYEGVRSNGGIESEKLFNPPLRSRERVISGIFATAISRVAPRSYPEARVDRRLDDSDDGDGPKAGRVDYLSYYRGGVIACELKSGFVNYDRAKDLENNNYVTEVVKKRWSGVCAQALTAQNYLKDGKSEYDNPVSIALMTVGARRSRAVGGGGDTAVEYGFEMGFARSLCGQLENANVKGYDNYGPDFSAVYTFPDEFRRFVRLVKGKPKADSESFMPAIAFVAKVMR